jgi:hypothetical protein
MGYIARIYFLYRILEYEILAILSIFFIYGCQGRCCLGTAGVGEDNNEAYRIVGL